MFLDKYMTPSEQRIMFFLLIAGMVGILLHFSGIQAARNPDPDEMQKALQEPARIVYDINVVTAAELRTISGIGEVRAKAIIEYRDANKPIDFDDLLAVRGIGEITLNNIREYFTVDNSVDQKDSLDIEEREPTGSRAEKMNINDAALPDLMKVNGIGKVKGERVIEYLKVNPRIKYVDQLLDVKGIGHKTLENIKELFYADDD
jgi:competence protein ComEA